MSGSPQPRPLRSTHRPATVAYVLRLIRHLHRQYLDEAATQHPGDTP